MSKNKKPPAGQIAEPEVKTAPVEVKGSGEYSFLDGSKYIGEWEEMNSIKVRHGTGTFINGPESYVGEWSNDFMSGHGEYIFCSGASYKGHFVNGTFDGHGKYTFPDLAYYDGEWKNGKMHGKGEYFDADGVKWAGDFFNGLYDSGRSYVSLRPSTAI